MLWACTAHLRVIYSLLRCTSEQAFDQRKAFLERDGQSFQNIKDICACHSLPLPAHTNKLIRCTLSSQLCLELKYSAHIGWEKRLGQQSCDVDTTPPMDELKYWCSHQGQDGGSEENSQRTLLFNQATIVSQNNRAANDRPFNTTGGKSTLEYKRPWRTRKLEEASAGDCAQEAQQKNGLAPDAIRKATPLQHSDGFNSIM